MSEAGAPLPSFAPLRSTAAFHGMKPSWWSRRRCFRGRADERPFSVGDKTGLVGFRVALRGLFMQRKVLQEHSPSVAQA